MKGIAPYAVENLDGICYKICRMVKKYNQYMGLSTVLSTISTEMRILCGKIMHTVQRYVDKGEYGLLHKVVHRVLHNWG